MKSPINLSIILVIAALVLFNDMDTYAEEIVDRQHYFDMHAGFQVPVPIEVRLSNSSSPSLNGRIGLSPQKGGVLALLHGSYLSERLRVEATIAHGQFHDLDMELQSGFVGNPDLGRTVEGVGKIDISSFTATVLYDLPDINEDMTPFIGLGGTAGVIRQRSVGRKGGDFFLQDEDVLTALCLIAGTNIKLNERTDLSLRYTGIFRSGVEFQDQNALGSFGAEMPGGFDNAFSVGIRYFYK